MVTVSISVIFDPDEVDRFAVALDQFSRYLTDEMNGLAAEFARLGDTWRDPAYERFGDELKQAVQLLQRFNRAAEEYVPHLHEMAEGGREVNRRRYRFR